MAKMNEVRFMVTSICPADQAAEGDRLYRSHIDWMKGTHHREGPKALMSYDVSKTPELSDPFDLASKPTGNTVLDGELENGLEGLRPLEAVFICRAQAPLTQLVANRVSARLAAHVVAHTALHEVGFVGAPEKDKSRAIIARLAISGNLPAPLQQLLDGWAVAGRVARSR